METGVDVEGGKGHCSLSRYFVKCDGQASLSAALSGTLSSMVSSLENGRILKYNVHPTTLFTGEKTSANNLFGQKVSRQWTQT